MTVTAVEPGEPREDPQDDGRSIEAVTGHHETREQRHFKERLAVWLFIGGDLVFLLMELFFWFYLRALNTNGLWRGAACSKANPCTDGLGQSDHQRDRQGEPGLHPEHRRPGGGRGATHLAGGGIRPESGQTRA